MNKKQLIERVSELVAEYTINRARISLGPCASNEEIKDDAYVQVDDLRDDYEDLFEEVIQIVRQQIKKSVS